VILCWVVLLGLEKYYEMPFRLQYKDSRDRDSYMRQKGSAAPHSSLEGDNRLSRPFGRSVDGFDAEDEIDDQIRDKYFTNSSELRQSILIVSGSLSRPQLRKTGQGAAEGLDNISDALLNKGLTTSGFSTEAPAFASGDTAACSPVEL
jgi:hypothetical protein